MLSGVTAQLTTGQWWAVGVKYVVSGSGGTDEEPRIQCYASPGLAALLNGLSEQIYPSSAAVGSHRRCRAREEENADAIDLAAEAVHTALRMADLDLPALADR